MQNYHNPAILRAVSLALLLGAGPAAFGQATAPAKDKDETIALPQFTITENAVNPYQSSQALSASRVAMPIQDIPQTISVVTSDLIQDSMGQKMLDVAKYVTPITESSLTMGSDRYQIRGYQVSHEFIDGTEISGQDGYSMTLAPYNIERIEIIKGPNAILVPGGSPGGQMNPITKSPIGKNQASTTLELATYFGTGASFDVNRVLTADGKQAARVIAGYWRSEGYQMAKYRNGYIFAPSYSIQLTPGQKLTLKGEVVQNRETNDSGIPLDPRVGSNDYARVAEGLPRNWSFGDDTDTRHRATERASGELLSTWGSHLTSRLQVMADHVIRSDIGGTNASIAGLPGGGGGTRNPNTGLYEPGVVWTVDNSGATAVATSVTTPIATPSTWVYTRNQGRVYLEYTESHIKNDWAMRFDNDLFKSTTIAGFAGNKSKVHFKSYPAAARLPVSAASLGSITYGGYAFQQPTAANGGTDKVGEQTDLQFFAYENVSLWSGRLQLSGGYSHFNGDLDRTDNSGVGLVAGAPLTYSRTSNAETFGVVIKPIKEVSLFYGYNTTGGTMPGSLSAGTIIPAKVAEGNQKEYGIKLNFLDNTFTSSISYFDITQANYAAPNSQYYVLVAQGDFAGAAALPNPLYLDLTSKGWEVELSYALSKNLTLIGNYTDFRLRQPFDVKYRAVADQSGAGYVDYRFTEGMFSGFGVNFGIDYKGEAPGDQVNPAYTTTKPLPGAVKFVPQQPSFKVAGRTIYNLGFSYRTPTWTARLTIVNLMNQDYIQAALNRNSLYVGDPRSLRSSFTYKF